MSDGNHTLYIHAKDAAGNWGTTTSITLTIDKTAPVITGVTLVPGTIAIGAASVTLNVTANDGTGVGILFSLCALYARFFSATKDAEIILQFQHLTMTDETRGEMGTKIVVDEEM